MAFDIAKYAADLELDETDAAALAAILAKGNRSTRFENGFRRQSDYDRTMDEGKKRIQAAADEADRRQQQLQESLTAVERLKHDTTGALEEAMAQARVAEERAAKSESALRRVAKEGGLDPDEIVKSIGLEPVEKKRDETPAFDEKKFRSEFGREVGAGLRTVADIAAELADLQAEHHELFGKPLVGAQKLVAAVASAKDGMTLRQAWEQEHKVAERRDEMREKSVQKRIDESNAETERRVRSEQALEGGVRQQRANNPSPVFQNVQPIDAKHNRTASPHLMKAAADLAARRAARIAGGTR